MKRNLLTCFVCTLILSLTACHHHRGSTIVVNGPGKHIYINYQGDVSFSGDSTRIEGLSAYGYLFYEKNDHKIEVTGDKDGKYSLTLYHRNDTAAQDEAGKKIIAEAVKEMMELGVRSSHRDH